MDWINAVILIGTSLVLVSILTSIISFRFGAPLLLVFLVIGLLAGEDGPGGIRFEDPSLAYFIGSLALAAILFESGIGTSLRSYRVAATPAIVLATVGVILTAALMALAARWLLGLTWLQALLIGAIVSSTDAAAVFFLLRVGGIAIRERVRSTLEIESGTNDPMAIFLTITLVELIASGEPISWEVLYALLLQAGVGAALGVSGGFATVWAIRRLKLESGLYPVFSLALALFVFALTSVLHGSGFLAVYLAGLIVGNARLPSGQALRRFHDGITWLSQIVMFLILGLFATPSEFLGVLPFALALAVVLIFVARPVAIWICLLPFGFSRQETAFIAWVGLRGAVSILLAIVPILEGLPNSQLYFNIAFLIVLISLMMQGWTIRMMARWLRLILPPSVGAVERMELDLPGQADYELITYRVHPESSVAAGRRPPRWARPSLTVRDGRVVAGPASRQPQAGDYVYVFATPSYIPLLDKVYGGRRIDVEQDQDFFGEFAFGADVPVGRLAEMYGLPLPAEDLDIPLGDYFNRRFRDRPVVGDRIQIGPIDLIVREIENERISSVGVALDATARRQPYIPLFHGIEELRRLFGRARHRLAKYVRRL